MFKITIIGIDSVLLTAVESTGKIEYINETYKTFTASFDGCEVKIRGDMIRIKNPKKHIVLHLFNDEFEEINIK